MLCVICVQGLEQIEQIEQIVFICNAFATFLLYYCMHAMWSSRARATADCVHVHCFCNVLTALLYACYVKFMWRSHSRLTKNFASKISEADIPVALVVVQATQTAVAVEGQDAKKDEESGSSAPPQKGHDQEGVTHNERIVQCSNHVKAHFPGRVCSTECCQLYRHVNCIVLRHLMQKSLSST